MNTNNNRMSIKEIFHPIDLAQQNQVAFSHALKLALLADANLTLFHVITNHKSVDGSDFPSTVKTLESWGFDTEESQVRNQIITSKGSDPVDSALFHLEHSPADLIVMATTTKQGLSRLMERAIAQPIASESGARVLFLPDQSNGFVDVQTGQSRMRRILVPISQTPDVNATLEYLADLLCLLDDQDSEITLFHVGSESSLPQPTIPDSLKDRCQTVIHEGGVVNAIKNYVEEYNPNLIVLTTQGKRGLIKMLLGGNTEQILKFARCAVLGIPCPESIHNQPEV